MNFWRDDRSAPRISRPQPAPSPDQQVTPEDCVIINLNETSFQRNFNLGHELFHILTWAAMHPAHVDVIAQDAARPKVERLADYFASGLLMPLNLLKARWDIRGPGQDLQEWIITISKEFKVPGEALYRRLVNTGMLPKIAEVDRRRLSRWNEDDQNCKPNIYNSELVHRLSSVLENGLVSVRKAAELLDCEPHGLKKRFQPAVLLPRFELNNGMGKTIGAARS